ncbi:MAG: ABC transporter ATP-binding protein [Lachnospiraceae bacterium]|nr:ABC transporter ATP-binding protein [Lachnospiraceae bacterium]
MKIEVTDNTAYETEDIITAKDLVKSYRLGDGSDLTVLDHMNLSLPKGKLIMIMGRSGSGKTTLINVLSSLDTFNSGSVSLMGHEYSQMSDRDKELLRRYQMGFVFQSVALIPAMTACENIDFGLRTAGVKEGRKERIAEVLESVGLAERGNHYPVELSGGERQRIAIARAMAHRPRVIFADEPTGALDTESGFHIADLFLELAKKEQITIVMTTHDVRISEMADEVIRL